MSPQVSIISPCYNQDKYLSEAIDSVLAQTLQEWELIVVDDGSTDNSAEIAQAYAAKDNRIKYVWQENAGPSAARNKGVALTSAPLLFFLDGDDRLHPEILQRGVEYMQSHDDCVLYYTRAQFFDKRSGEFVLNYTSYRDELTANNIDCACMIRRTDFLRVGGFDEDLRGYEDWEFFIRLLYHNGKVHRDSEILFDYRISDNPTSVNLQAMARHDEKTMYIYRKHLDKYIEYFGSPFHVTAEYNRLDKELKGILASETYLVGKLMLAPLAFLKCLLRKKINN